MKSDQIVECVPNISEGRDPKILDLLSASIRSARLLHRSADPDHNRSVFTLAGSPSSVLEASLQLAEAAFACLRLEIHTGVHPRIGVLDVLPFVPVQGVSLEDCAALARSAAQEIWRRFGVPAFFYEAAGVRPLEEVRRVVSTGALPDVGAGLHPTAGAVAIGARDFLIAWNIWLQTENVSVAKNIAKTIRASNGGFPGVKALGLSLPSRNLVQVSINTVDYHATPLHETFERVDQLARQAGVGVLGSELIGLIPLRAVELSRGHDLRWLHWDPDMIFERRYSKGSAGNSLA